MFGKNIFYKSCSKHGPDGEKNYFVFSIIDKGEESKQKTKNDGISIIFFLYPPYPALYNRRVMQVEVQGQISTVRFTRYLISGKMIEIFGINIKSWDTEYLLHKHGDFFRNLLINKSRCPAFFILYYIQHYKIQ